MSRLRFSQIAYRGRCHYSTLLCRRFLLTEFGTRAKCIFASRTLIVDLVDNVQSCSPADGKPSERWLHILKICLQEREVYISLASPCVLTTNHNHYTRSISLHFKMLRINAIAILSTFLLFETSAAINACPVTDTVFTGTQGIRYRVCPNTDLIGKSQVVTPRVASTAACAQLCDRSLDCFKAVYDTKTKDCHFKANAGLNWQPNERFDVIQAEQINIARCPYTETAYRNNGVSSSTRVKFRQRH